MDPLRRRIFGPGIVVALLVTLPLVGLPQTAMAADLGEEPSGGSAAKGGEPSAQADDADRPKDKSLLEKQPADAAVAQKKQEVAGPPFYERWQFWAITGGVIVGVIGLIWAGQKVAHQVNGGDVRPCNNDAFIGCFGEGH
jgi:hypothetical protein